MPGTVTVDLESLRARFLEAQLAGNRREALRLLTEEGAHRGLSVMDLALGVIQEAQREIGRLWQENSISVADEHLGTAIAQVALAHLYQLGGPAPRLGKKILFACVAGEQHDFPARLAADARALVSAARVLLSAPSPSA